MSRVLVVDANRRPLTPCTPARARMLLKQSKAAVLRRFPFVIVLKDARPEACATPLRLKIDPGAKTTGLAVVNDTTGEVAWTAEITHRGEQVHQDLLKRAGVRRGRRFRHTRYRQARWRNRRRPQGWLAPSLLSRVHNVLTWVAHPSRWCPLGAISYELVRFDMQLLHNPQIERLDYQHGTLSGIELRHYLLAKWEHRCAYCHISGFRSKSTMCSPVPRGAATG